MESGGLKEHWVVEGDLPGHVASAVVNKRGCDLLNSRMFFCLSPTWISVSGAHRSNPFLLSASRCGPRIARSWPPSSWEWVSLLDLDGVPHLLAPLPASSPPGAASLSWGPRIPTPLSQAASCCTSCLQRGPGPGEPPVSSGPAWRTTRSPNERANNAELKSGLRQRGKVTGPPYVPLLMPQTVPARRTALRVVEEAWQPSPGCPLWPPLQCTSIHMVPLPSVFNTAARRVFSKHESDRIMLPCLKTRNAPPSPPTGPVARPAPLPPGSSQAELLPVVCWSRSYW